ncbi:MAG: DUF1822 family protein [Nostoc sp. EfeVER01]|uniref:DUF1822 family protein n=1 Tax=unclassified Nostoc TaxID=2593658 RepID=UPI002AD1E171|nr:MULTISPECIES: DUF1822 family protein [unclassified Nostoc]MDZ7943790.1 DUF1822 family protein [Nostoc sp. EfeVER01]MDZ7990778.1 DUF1822 family protein [Nostoc sp. EspVER01]
MLNPPAPFTIDSQHLYLEITQFPEVQEQPYSTAGACQRGWINQKCLQAFLPWFQEEMAPTARVYPNSAALPSFWEVVNGTAITFDRDRLVLIPTLAMDGDELRVPQEWVDIPEWVADYYIAVQVNPDDGWMRIFGYTTHKILKTKGVYDAGDRTYSLEKEDLIPDINVLWVTRQLDRSETLRAEIAPLDPIGKTQAENLLERLGDRDVKFPRLAVPFSLWGALLAHSGWRKKLYERRQGLLIQRSIPQWLQTGVANLAQLWGWEKREFVAVPVGMRSAEPVLGLSRQIIIAEQTYELRIFPKSASENYVWRFELRSTTLNGQIPAGFKLRLLTEDLQAFENNQDTATTAVDMLYLEVILELGEGLVWEIEPTPEDYEREILRF